MNKALSYSERCHLRNMMTSRALLLRLKKFHASHLPMYPLPSTIVGCPLKAAVDNAKARKKARQTQSIVANSVGAVSKIISLVAAYYGLTSHDLLSDRRTARITHPRQVAMHLITRYTRHSYPTIGRMINRDHTTVLHGDKIIKNKIKSDAVVAIQVETIAAQIEACGIKPATVADRAYRRTYEDTWTQDRVEKLVSLRETGMPFKTIAREIGGGISDSACWYKYSRLLASGLVGA